MPNIVVDLESLSRRKNQTLPEGLWGAGWSAAILQSANVRKDSNDFTQTG
jgi:hypothetical protein